MGNKQSRSKSTSDMPSKKRKKGKNKSLIEDAENKHQSMPELGGAVPYKTTEEPREVNVTIHRSYKDLHRSRSSIGRDDQVGYKVYRRNTGGWTEKPRTLPRNFGRNKSRSINSPVRDAYTPNGTIDPGFPGLDAKDLVRGSRSSARSSKRASRSSSMVGSTYPVLPCDFPVTDAIKLKLQKFEELFVAKLTQKFSELPEETQIGILVIARDKAVKNRRVSLKEYTIEGGVVPEDLLSPENKDCYQLVIPESLFYGIEHIRHEKNNDLKLWCSLARDVVACIATEAGNDLTRIYEYQIVLMYDDVSMRILTEHAVECIMEYIQGHYLDRNSAVRSVIQVYPPNHEGTSKYISGVIGNKELKWDLYEIFKKPGLRKELFLVSAEYAGDSECIDHQPWQYTYSQESEPFLYGYRGQMIEWDFIEGHYKLDAKENDVFTDEIAFLNEDYHRLYMPYKRLFGAGIMAKYLKQEDGILPTRSLVQMIKCEPLEGPPERENILPVYRPVSVQPASLPFQKSNLNHVDLVRANMADSDLSETSMQSANLLFANLKNSNFDHSKLAGADISYATVDGKDFDNNNFKGTKANHVVLNNSLSPPDSPDGVSPVQSPGSDDFNTSFVSDGQGNVVPIVEVVEKHKAHVEEEEKLKAEEAARVKSSPIAKGSDGQVVQLAGLPPSGGPGSKRRRKKKKKLDGIKTEPSANSSFTEADVDRFFGDRKSIPPPGYSPIISPKQNGVTPPSSAKQNGNYIHMNGNSPLFTNGDHRKQFHSHDDVLTASTASAYNAEPPRQGSTPLLDAEVAPTNRAIQSRYSTAERRPKKLAPRMTKSFSHHGQLSGKYNTLQPDEPGSLKKNFSNAELEQMRRSQIFKMLRGLQPQNIESTLPPLCQPFLGRAEEVEDIADLLNSSGRLITLNGCPGIGKSNLAIAVAKELEKKYIVSIYTDARTCVTVDSLVKKMMSALGLHFKQSELDYFYQWVNSHEQRLLFVFDNLELNSETDRELSEFFDKIIYNVKNARILSTSHGQFYRGQVSQETYRVGDIRKFSEELLQGMIPDCHEEGVSLLANAVDHILFGLKVCGKAFQITDVDAGSLYEQLSSGRSDVMAPSRLEDVIRKHTTNDTDAQHIFRLAIFIHNVLSSMPALCEKLVSKLSNIPASFDLGAVQSFVVAESEDIDVAIKELVNVGLFLQMNNRFCIPKLVRVVAQACWPDDGTMMVKISQYYIEKLKSLTKQFHSNESHDAMMDMQKEFDNITAILRWILEREDAYETCSSFADMEYAIFLSETLPSSLYEDLYESLSQQAGENDDVLTRTNALCCSSYKCMSERNFDNARAYAENAYETMNAAQVSEVDKAFCIQCLGKAYWQDENRKEKGLTLVKCALDIYKSNGGLHSVKALYSNEEYGKLLHAKDFYQKARHIFNVSDLMLSELLDCHPMLIAGYDCRRLIWDKFFLFSRSTEIAQKAVDTARRFYGDHPLTATMLNNMVECIIKRGSLHDGVDIAVEALAIRIKVLGDHIDTGLSYKLLANVMMRTGQYDEAMRFAQSGLEVYGIVDAPEKYKIEVQDILAQATFKLSNRSSQYIQINSRNASKTNVSEENQLTASPNHASTEV